MKYKNFVENLSGLFRTRVGLNEPEFSGNERKYVLDCIDTAWVSTAGKYVDQFEDKVREIAGTHYAIATNTGTSALHTLYLALGIGQSKKSLRRA